ncbi:LbetaH domain-containing protein [Marinigracilibium pacificum]|uniref:UDP-3-O-[3-hydroxymyristoyl] glucosamine N-acyltransferase n=1 Tax=Marinigracilibium pacificum TaxID=2729599 RepID=A0A848J173_9BACT|nr:hypothetical protein [Marinigracilibium pacificum]NMM48049.1 hypothetical protein [Marinigracilibium pacificum]
MIKITSDIIKEKIFDLGIEGELINFRSLSITPASIFSPINEGLYFDMTGNLESKVKNSFIIANTYERNIENCNIYFLTNQNVQVIFYKLLSELFPEKSTGKISQQSIIDPEAEIGENVQIDPFCVIGKVKIEDDVIIKNNCHIHDNSYISVGTIIEPMSVIGARGMAWIWNENQTEKIIQPQLGGVIVGKYCILGANTIAVRGSLSEKTIIGDYTMMAPGCRLGHGSVIGEYVHFANNVVTGGNTKIGDYCFIGSSATFRPKVEIGKKTIVGAGANVVKNNSDEGVTLVGNPARAMQTSENPSGMPKPKK